MNVLIIIPAYNEELNIEKTVKEVLEKCPGTDFVVINDGSTDRTADICRRNGYPLIDLPVNLGLAGAFQTGMKYAAMTDYDAAMQFDADGQHVAEYVAAMTAIMEKDNADVVIGSRFVDKRKPANMRMAGSSMISAAIKATTGKKLTDPTSGMRLYSRRIIQKLAEDVNYGPEPDTIAFLLRCGAKVTEIQVTMREREYGKSYLTLGRSINYMMKMCLSITFIQFFRKESLD